MRSSFPAGLPLLALLATTTLAVAQDRVTPPQNPDTGQINRGGGEATRPPTGAPPGAMQQSAPGDQVGDVQSPRSRDNANVGAAQPAQEPAVNAGPSIGPIGATGQTMPALFSERNAKLDKVPLVALTFELTPEQRAAVLAATRDAKPASPSNDVAAATLAPDDATLADLPAAAVEQAPTLKGYKYFRAGDKVVIVSPPNRIAVAVIGR